MAEAQATRLEAFNGETCVYRSPSTAGAVVVPMIGDALVVEVPMADGSNRVTSERFKVRSRALVVGKSSTVSSAIWRLEVTAEAAKK